MFHLLLGILARWAKEFACRKATATCTSPRRPIGWWQLVNRPIKGRSDGRCTDARIATLMVPLVPRKRVPSTLAATSTRSGAGIRRGRAYPPTWAWDPAD